MKPQRVLVTDAGRTSALAVIRSLGRAGHTVVAADSAPHPTGARSRYATALAQYPSAFDAGAEATARAIAGLADRPPRSTPSSRSPTTSSCRSTPTATCSPTAARSAMPGPRPARRRRQQGGHHPAGPLARRSACPATRSSTGPRTPTASSTGSAPPWSSSPTAPG